MVTRRFFVTQESIQGDKIRLTESEHNHLRNVLSLKVGNEIIVVCGDEYDYICKVSEITKNYTIADIVRKEANEYNPKNHIDVFQAMVKKQGMELIVQKLTELGVSTLIPFESKFSTVKMKEGKGLKLQKISEQSVKQCRRSKPLVVLNPCKIDDIYTMLQNYDVVLFANECEGSCDLSRVSLQGKNKVAIVVGSEGGFAPEEIDKLARCSTSVSLGKRILRAETASIGLTAIVMFLMGEYNY